MTSVDQAGVQQQQQGKGRLQDQTGGVYISEKGFGRSLSQGRYYSPQAHSAFYAPQRSFRQRQQAVGGDDFVIDEDSHPERTKSSRGGKFAAFLALSWVFSWPCHGPCWGSS